MQAGSPAEKAQPENERVLAQRRAEEAAKVLTHISTFPFILALLPSELLRKNGATNVRMNHCERTSGSCTQVRTTECAAVTRTAARAGGNELVSSTVIAEARSVVCWLLDLHVAFLSCSFIRPIEPVQHLTAHMCACVEKGGGR